MMASIRLAAACSKKLDIRRGQQHAPAAETHSRLELVGLWTFKPAASQRSLGRTTARLVRHAIVGAKLSRSNQGPLKNELEGDQKRRTKIRLGSG